LIFSLETYDAVANAYIAGLEQRAAAGQPIDRVASVASVFVSRIDSAVDKLLDEQLAKGEQVNGLLGATGLANLKLIYARFKKLFESERFAALAANGAHVQRPLWASTGTKNPAYPDLLYVENLVGKQTVNTGNARRAARPRHRAARQRRGKPRGSARHDRCARESEHLAL
jgi:transaldolase/glucose-6-phosphate isomerase